MTVPAMLAGHAAAATRVRGRYPGVFLLEFSANGVTNAISVAIKVVGGAFLIGLMALGLWGIIVGWRAHLDKRNSKRRPPNDLLPPPFD